MAVLHFMYCKYRSVADLHSKIVDARHPLPRGSKFFKFHAVFGKFWQNRMLAPSPRGVGAPTSGKSWIRHCRRVSTLIGHYEILRIG